MFRLRWLKGKPNSSITLCELKILIEKEGKPI